LRLRAREHLRLTVFEIGVFDFLGCERRNDAPNADGRVKAGSHSRSLRTQADKAFSAIAATPEAMAARRLLLVKRFAFRRYRSFPNVLAVGVGAKFESGPGRFARARKLKGLTCIQFFVVRKRKDLRPRHRLPKFLYQRFGDGRVDFRAKVPTDVISVGGLRAACGAGSRLDSSRDHGLITLIFRNKAQAGQPFYLITCAHVAGDIRRSPPAYPELTSDDSSARPLARTLFNSTARAGGIDYDIALAKIDAGALPLPELRIRNTGRALSSFLPLRSIQQGLDVGAALRGHSIHGTVDSLQMSAAVSYGGETVLVHNLFGVNVSADPGDSGGLVYRGAQAVGIVVAASPRGWLWFQPLGPATEFLDRIAPFRISIFKPQPLHK
jgi:hypothetical protein